MNLIKLGLSFVLFFLIFTHNLYAEIIDVPTIDHPTIQSAIDAANTGDEIKVAPGTYYETIDFKGKAIRLFSSNGAESTIIDGNNNCPVVRFTTQEGPNAILEGISITGGYGTFMYDIGAGVQIIESNPTVINCTFRFNAIKSGLAGGMFIRKSNAKIIGCKFIENGADYGAAIYIEEDSTPTITGCAFIDHMAMAGGGIYIFNSDPVISNCNFVRNKGDYGGGAIINENGNPTVLNCIFTNNESTYKGGGIWNSNSYNPNIINCVFNGNTGGGIANDNSHPYIKNCTFYGNLPAIELGGGILNTLSSPIVINCVLWGNSNGQINGSTAYVSYSNVQGGYDGIGNIDADPLFVDPENNNFQLQSGSQCIDKGDNAAVADILTDLDGNARILDGDLDGTATVDMGAYEFQYPDPVIENIDYNNCISEPCTTSLAASAHDPAGGTLSYAWDEYNDGTVDGTGTSFLFVPTGPSMLPDCTPYPVKLTVTSSISGLSAEQIVGITVKPAGDANGDGSVNFKDKLLIKNNFGLTTFDPLADVNCDGYVNTKDKRVVKNQLGQSGCACCCEN